MQYFRPSLSYHFPLKPLFLSIFKWPLKTGFTVYQVAHAIWGTYYTVKQRVLRRVCANAQIRLNLRCSHILSMDKDEDLGSEL